MSPELDDGRNGHDGQVPSVPPRHSVPGEDRSITDGVNRDSLGASGSETERPGPVTHFENAWERGDRPPRIADYLSVVAAPDRGAFLVELARSDIKWCLKKKGQFRRVEYYLKHDPNLPPEDVASLIAFQYEIRLRHGFKVSHREYLERFPYLERILKRRFAAIDAAASSSDKNDTHRVARVQGLYARPDSQHAVSGFPVSLTTIFKPIRKLGEGGMGEVWHVLNLDLAKERAVKLILRAHLARDAASTERLKLEARAMARVGEHPHAVVVHHIGLDQDPYIEMEYLRGRSLSDVIKPKEPMPLEQITQIITQLCDTLQYAHDNDIIHRDLKPSNLMLVEGNSAEQVNLKVLDFGLAKFVGPSGGAALTIKGTTVGTPIYMSPEQLLDSSTVDKRCDLYSVGVILYELLTGCRPYEILHFPVPPFKARNPDVNVLPEIESFVLRCLDRDPSQRPSCARELAQEFLALVEPAITDHPNESDDDSIFPHVDEDFPRSLTAKFEPLEILGAGGMGAVWRVRHRALGKERAVKLIGAHLARDITCKERLRREAQAMAALDHPHAVAVYDVCVDNLAYIEMEYIRGRSLHEEMMLEGMLPLEKITQILTQLSDALQHAHDKGIIHRDLKPSNLMLAEQSASDLVNLKVLDFGLAKMRKAVDDPAITQPGATLGTLMYMSPEQLVNSSDVSPQSDLYSIGVILYELLTGSRPFTSENRFALRFEIDNFPVPPFKERNPNSTVAPAIEELVVRCLQKDPSERPQSARALAEEFLELVQPEALADTDTPVPEPQKFGRRWFLAGAAGVGGFCALWYSWTGPRPESRDRDFRGPVPPETVVLVPPGWEKAGAAKPFEENGKAYHWMIKRVVKDAAGKELEVFACFVPKSEDLDSFYIMENKVWVGLFRVFAAGNPGAVANSKWTKEDPDRWPVLGVTGPDAEKFAQWLGGPNRGYLPRDAQWLQAAGKNSGREGPFEGAYDPKSPGGIAIGRDKERTPLPVGAATQDKSPNGCRDMSGNGWEWVRPEETASTGLYVRLRAATFRATKPFRFNDPSRACEFGRPNPEVGFRVVIKPMP